MKKIFSIVAGFVLGGLGNVEAQSSHLQNQKYMVDTSYYMTNLLNLLGQYPPEEVDSMANAGRCFLELSNELIGLKLSRDNIPRQQDIQTVLRNISQENFDNRVRSADKTSGYVMDRFYSGASVKANFTLSLEEEQELKKSKELINDYMTKVLEYRKQAFLELVGEKLKFGSIVVSDEIDFSKDELRNYLANHYLGQIYNNYTEHYVPCDDAITLFENTNPIGYNNPDKVTVFIQKLSENLDGYNKKPISDMKNEYEYNTRVENQVNCDPIEFAKQSRGREEESLYFKDNK